MKVLFIGDVVGNPGRRAVKEMIPDIRKVYDFDFCFANCENAAGGSGITYPVAQELYKSGIDAITMGNHTWSKREVLNFIETDSRIVRPANYPQETPGRGFAIIEKGDLKIGIVNIQGRVYMDPVDCPFKAAERDLELLKKHVKPVVLDIHAEATSEKYALAWHLDGKVSCVLGTHTHVQTSDERILPNGTAYITDVGMTGPYDGILGMDKDIVIKKFITQMPVRFELAQGKVQFNAVIIDIDEKTGKTNSIERISKVL